MAATCTNEPGTSAWQLPLLAPKNTTGISLPSIQYLTMVAGAGSSMKGTSMESQNPGVKAIPDAWGTRVACPINSLPNVPKSMEERRLMSTHTNTAPPSHLFSPFPLMIADASLGRHDPLLLRPDDQNPTPPGPSPQIRPDSANTRTKDQKPPPFHFRGRLRIAVARTEPTSSK